MENALWMIAGAILSAWTGIVTARWFEYKSAIRDVLAIVADQDAIAMSPAESLFAHNAVLRTRLRLNILFEDQGQFAVAQAVHRICERRDDYVARTKAEVITAKITKQDLRPLMDTSLAQLQGLLTEVRNLKADPCGLAFGKRLTAILREVEMADCRRGDIQRMI